MAGKETGKTQREPFKSYLERGEVSLRAEYVELSKTLMALRFQQAAGQLENTRLLRRNRRLKARVKTALSILSKTNKDAQA